MQNNFQIRFQESGRLRIYLSRRQRRKSGLRAFFGPPLYDEIVRAASQDGIHTAIARRTHIGYRSRDTRPGDRLELSTARAPVEVELIAPRKILKVFCYKRAQLLHDTVLLFEELEHWDINGHGAAERNAVESAV